MCRISLSISVYDSVHCRVMGRPTPGQLRVKCRGKRKICHNKTNDLPEGSVILSHLWADIWLGAIRYREHTHS